LPSSSAIFVADVAERPSHPLSIHQRFASGFPFRPGNAGQHDLAVPGFSPFNWDFPVGLCLKPLQAYFGLDLNIAP
jgi:hypothetical protein